MDFDMWQRMRQQFPAWLSGRSSAKLVTAMVILVVPGGLMLPLCYAAYAAFSHSTRRRPHAGTDTRADGAASAASRLMRLVTRDATSSRR